VPLALATGAGSEMRRALGTTVFWGMLGVTGFGLLLTPVFYVVVRLFTQRGKTRPTPAKQEQEPLPEPEKELALP
jgi:Cu/Ag efflux pump CusA